MTGLQRNRTQVLLVEVQAQSWDVVTAGGRLEDNLTTMERLDARSDAYLIATLRTLRLIETDPARAVELARVGTIQLVNGIHLDNAEDEVRSGALGLAGRMQAAGRWVSAAIDAFFGGKGAAVESRKRVRA